MNAFSEGLIIQKMKNILGEYIEIDPAHGTPVIVSESAASLPILLAIPGPLSLRKVEGQRPYVVTSGGDPLEVVDVLLKT